jgi:endonuclease/exonuclease/phosphatase (EEP) superfamily protein YafD
MYLLILLSLWCIVHFVGERWWLAALVLFGPRWMLALPMGVLIPIVLWRRPRMLLVLAICVCVLAGPLMDLRVPWRRMFEHSGAGPHLRVLTCNTHSNALSQDALAALIDATRPDVVALQEWSGGYNAPPLGGGNWHVLTDHELRVQSRYPIRKKDQLVSAGWSFGMAIRYEIQTPAGPVPFYNLHLASPHNALESAINLDDSAASQIKGNQTMRREQSADVSLDAKAVGDAVILAGDFNLPRDSEIFRENLSTFTDAFSAAGLGFGWTYRHGGTATRIDHILAGRDWVCRRCWVGSSVRSPHRPVIADWEFVGRFRG